MEEEGGGEEGRRGMENACLGIWVAHLCARIAEKCLEM